MMKQKTIILTAMSALLIMASCTNAPESDKAVTGEARTAAEAAGGQTLTVDTAQSNLTWIGTKVTGYHSGTVPITGGTLTVRNDSLAAGRFTMDMSRMAVTGPDGSDAAGNKKLLGHLQSPDFFDVANHPEATFEITGIRPFTGTVKDTTDPRQEAISQYKVANPTHTISGNLTIKGVTKNIEFPAQVTTSADGLQALARFNIDRRQWNITYPGKPDDLIRDEIHMGIAVRANK